MAIKSSGALSFATDIVGEFADSAPHSMSEFYGGGDKVPAGANPGVATSGTINFNSFYDCVAATVLTISSNTNDYDIGTACIAAGGDKSTPVILTINSGVTVGSTSTSTPAMKTGTGWASGVSITITNNGSIVGSTGSNVNGTGGTGGGGGYGAQYSYCGARSGQAGSSGSNGSGSADSASNGGNAFEHSQTADNYLSVTFATSGTRTGGSAGVTSFPGGGGGGGGGPTAYGGGNWYYGGSGGGGGAANGSGGAGGLRANLANSPYCYSYSANGSAGGATTGGASNGNGGNGGDLGAAGSSSQGGGGSAGSSGNASGSSGSALSGNTGQIS